MEKQLIFPNFFRKFNSRQTELKDSTVMDSPAKVISFASNNYRVFRGDTMRWVFDSENVYVKNIGLYTHKFETDAGRYRSELVEQMPLSEFEKRAAHGLKRVAYIDPEKVMDKGSNFETCERYDKIFDYYNGDPDGSFIGGKGALWQAIIPQLEKEAIEGQSGYLTFRFIINCEGEIGNFILEQADLDFQKTEFSAKAVNHLFRIVRSLKKWQPCHIQKVPRDSYAYLTFKLKDGELIELLP